MRVGGDPLNGTDRARINSLFYVENNLVWPLAKSHFSAFYCCNTNTYIALWFYSSDFELSVIGKTI